MAEAVPEQADLPVSGWLGVGARWRGDLQFDGRVRIDGTLIGSIRSDDLLEIGAGGRVDGEVRVAQALIGGRFDGTLVATERVTLLDTAVVSGEVVSPWLDVRNGARIDALVRVQRDD
jgi:cytoskeletal protein CcmA (bactofilin family)